MDARIVGGILPLRFAQGAFKCLLPGLLMPVYSLKMKRLAQGSCFATAKLENPVVHFGDI